MQYSVLYPRLNQDYIQDCMQDSSTPTGSQPRLTYKAVCSILQSCIHHSFPTRALLSYTLFSILPYTYAPMHHKYPPWCLPVCLIHSLVPIPILSVSSPPFCLLLCCYQQSFLQISIFWSSSISASVGSNILKPIRPFINCSGILQSLLG